MCEYVYWHQPSFQHVGAINLPPLELCHGFTEIRRLIPAVQPACMHLRTRRNCNDYLAGPNIRVVMVAVDDDVALIIVEIVPPSSCFCSRRGPNITDCPIREADIET